MCGRFVITSPPAALRQIFGYIEQPNFPPRYNIAPTQPIPVVIIENGIRHFRLMRWGLLPAWVKDPSKFTLLINARADTVAIVTAPASPDLAVLHHRVPVTIEPGDFERWLDCGDDDAEKVMALLIAPGEGRFVWHEISTRVNRAANDDAQLILPITAEEMAAEEPRPAKKASPRKPAPAASEDDGQGSLF